MILDDDSNFAHLVLHLRSWAYDDSFFPFFIKTWVSIIISMTVFWTYVTILAVLGLFAVVVVLTLLHLIFCIAAPCLIKWLFAKGGEGFMKRFWGKYDSWEKSDTWTGFEEEAEAGDVEALKYRDGSKYEGNEWSAEMETLCGDEENAIEEGEVTEKESVESDEGDFVSGTG